jgi:hypothetical protein
VFALSGQQNNGRLAAPVERAAEQFNAVLGAEAVIDKADVVLIAGYVRKPIRKLP